MRTEYPARITKPIRKTLDTRGFAFPKPEPREKAQPKDGRLIESPEQYRVTKREMWKQQNQRCGKKGCGNYMPTPAHGNRHHPGGRGIGGSKRDDSKTVLWCIPCHDEEHEQLRRPTKGRLHGSSSGGKSVLPASSEMGSEG